MGDRRRKGKQKVGMRGKRCESQPVRLLQTLQRKKNSSQNPRTGRDLGDLLYSLPAPLFT